MHEKVRVVLVELQEELRAELAQIEQMLAIADSATPDKPVANRNSSVPPARTTAKRASKPRTRKPKPSDALLDRTLRFIEESKSPVRTREVASHLGVSFGTARNALQTLTDRKAIKYVGRAAGEKGVVHLYEKITGETGPQSPEVRQAPAGGNPAGDSPPSAGEQQQVPQLLAP